MLIRPNTVFAMFTNKSIYFSGDGEYCSILNGDATAAFRHVTQPSEYIALNTYGQQFTWYAYE